MNEEELTELVRAQTRRDIRFRINVCIIILVLILAIDMWRAYRNEMIWSRCVVFNDGMTETDLLEQKAIAP